MKLLANENIPLKTVEALRSAGEDVLSVTESSPGIADAEVLRLASAQGRVIITFDRDYGDLVFGRGLPPPAGVLYLRFVPKSPRELAAYVIDLKASGVQLEGRFTSASRKGIRQRPMREDG